MSVARSKSNNLNVSIVLTNYNGEELLRKNLPRVVKASEFKPNNVVEIIIVDDGSTDGSVEFLKKNYPAIKLIRHKEKMGFVSTTNTGVRNAEGDLVALLNSDVVPERDFLANSITHFKTTDVFAVSFHEKGFSWAKGFFKDGYVMHEPGKADNKLHETFWVSGGSAIFRRSYWKELGGMDEDLLSPFYWEDIDICYRAAKRGWKLLWEPKSVVEHKHESTIGKVHTKAYIDRVRERNQLLFLWKNLTSKKYLSSHIKGLTKRLVAHPKYIIIVLFALPRLNIALKHRKVEKKEASVSDEEVLSKSYD